ncbi:MAG: hypothetical protein AAGD13_09265 [Pseudomonadota bacterium]
MQYIPENDMAFDAAELGCASIGACQAICIHTSRGLSGFHDLKSAKSGGRKAMSSLQISNAKLGQFPAWVVGSMQPRQAVNAI